MRTLRFTAELRAQLTPARRAQRRIGLVPTMGALHDGHVSLIERARSECDVVVVSVFVNPSQFGPEEDLAAYPRDEAADAERARAAGADLLFAPTVAEVYPPGFCTSIQVPGVSEALCGAVRGATHFQGVATVVVKLLNMAGPDVLYLGQKDAQQAAVIRRVVCDLDIPVDIVVCPIVRAADGLALSSRNAYLHPRERRRAVALRDGLDATERAIAAGERDPLAAADAGRAAMAAHDVEPEYLEIVSPDSLVAVGVIEGHVLIANAARVGGARLIDNALVSSPQSSPPPLPSAFPLQIGDSPTCSV